MSQVGYQLIGGRRRTATGGDADGPATMPVTDPATGDVVVEVDLAGRADVETAVAAARAALPEWSRAAPGERSTVLTAMAQILTSLSLIHI